MFKQILKMFYFKIKYRAKDVVFYKKSNIGWGSLFEGHNRIGCNSSFSGYMGCCSYIGENVKFEGKVGRYCSIANDVKTIKSVHPTEKFVSTSPVFYSLLKQCGITYTNQQKFDEILYANVHKEGVKWYPVVVGNDVWIGAGATILPGVCVGDGAIVAANATVVKNIEPYSIVGGTPARIIRMRFSEEEINYLLNLKWWDKDEEWIAKRADLFVDISNLMSCEDEF